MCNGIIRFELGDGVHGKMSYSNGDVYVGDMKVTKDHTHNDTLSNIHSIMSSKIIVHCIVYILY